VVRRDVQAGRESDRHDVFVLGDPHNTASEARRVPLGEWIGPVESILATTTSISNA
jgi:hypothetical protein